MIALPRHPSEGWGPDDERAPLIVWMPAFAGMTEVMA
jgi:hypothetical protein